MPASWWICVCVWRGGGGGTAVELENKLRIEKIKWKHEFLITEVMRSLIRIPNTPDL